MVSGRWAVLRLVRGIVFAIVAYLGVAEARAAKDEGTSACDNLKPEQRLSEERQAQLDTAINLGIRGLGQGRGSLGKSSESSVQIQVLQDDALAKGWFVYQTCVMKEARIIDEITAQELVRMLMGLEPTSVTITTGVTAPAAAGPILRLRGDDPAVELTLDGANVGALATGVRLPVEVGVHELLASRKGFRTHEASLDVPPAGLDYTLPQLRKKRKTWLYVGLLGGAAIVGGTVAGAAAAVAASNTTTTFPTTPSTSTSTSTCYTTYPYYGTTCR